MKKETKKTLKTIKTKTAQQKAGKPTEKAPAEKKTVDFKTALHDTGDLRQALRLSKAQRAEY